MTKISFEMGSTVTVALGKDTGQRAVVDIAKLAKFEKLWPALVSAAIKTILINTYNGEGKDATQEVKVAKVNKKLDAWYAGEFNIVDRGDSMYTAMREAYIDSIRAKAAGVTTKQVEDMIRANVTAVFGEKEKATFANFIAAMGTLMNKQDETLTADEHAAAFEQDLMDMVAAKAKVAAETKVDLTALSLATFKKKAPSPEGVVELAVDNTKSKK